MAIVITLASIKAGIISAFSAGEDITDICSPTISLIATVDGDLFAHTILWEQISGPAVTIDNPTALSTFYTVAGLGKKVFRFTIDKGTPQEQFDELIVKDTPEIDMFSAGMSNVYSSIVRGPIPFPVTVVNGNVVNTPDAPPTQPHGEAAINSVFTLTWDHPTQANDGYIVSYGVVENTVLVDDIPSSPLLPTETGVAPTGPPVDDKSYDLGAITNYQILTRYNFHGVEKEGPSAVFDFSGVVVDPVVAIDDSIGMSNTTNFSLSLQRFTNTIAIFGDDTQSMSLSSNFVNVISRYTPTVEFVPDDDISSMSSTTLIYLDLTRFDPSGIGGSQ